MIIVLLGAPGAGKGAQGEILKKNLEKVFKERINTKEMEPSINNHTRLIIMGNILRVMSLEDSKLRKKLNSGILLSSEYINSVMQEYFRKESLNNVEDIFIFDGYPRSIEQAEFLYKNIYLSGVFIVINIDVDLDIAKDRILSRAVCNTCKHQFNSKGLESCPKCSSRDISKRGDDNDKIVKKRFDEYNNKTRPILDYYKSLGIDILSIDGNKNIDIVSSEILKNIMMVI